MQNLGYTEPSNAPLLQPQTAHGKREDYDKSLDLWYLILAPLKHGDRPLPRRIDSDSTHGAIDEAMSDDRSPPRSLDQNLTGKDK